MHLSDHFHVEYRAGRNDDRVLMSHLAETMTEAQRFVEVGREDAYFPVIKPCGDRRCLLVREGCA